MKVGLHPGYDVAILHLVIDALFPPISVLGALEGILLEDYALGRVIQVVGVAVVTMAVTAMQVAAAAALFRGRPVVFTAAGCDAERREKCSERDRQKHTLMVFGVKYLDSHDCSPWWFARLAASTFS
jgi:stage V sporulation protein SpoVS